MLSLQKSNFFIIIIHETHIIYLYLISSIGKISYTCIKNLEINPFLSWSTRPEPMPIHKENWKQKWRLKAKISFQNKTHTLSLWVSHCACAFVSVRKMEAQAAEEPVQTKMESLRLTCEREIQIHQQKIDSYASSFRSSLQSIKSRAQQTAQNQGLLHDHVLFFSVFPSHFCKIRVLIFWVWDCVSLTQIRVLIV